MKGTVYIDSRVITTIKLTAIDCTKPEGNLLHSQRSNASPCPVFHASELNAMTYR